MTGTTFDISPELAPFMDWSQTLPVYIATPNNCNFFTEQLRKLEAKFITNLLEHSLTDTDTDSNTTTDS